MKIIKIVIVVLLFLLALALGAQNQSLVSVNYLVAKSEVHLSMLIGVVFVLGFAAAAVLFSAMHFKLKLQNRRLTKKVSQLAIESDRSVQVDK
ncbi:MULTISPECIES: lipopolysaccharide assembly protein LapA domain-containing protein [unclassified Vibrio]|uniref:Probable lipopolysaccharide assembly protein A n=1 Tax=Vibrio sp. HB236076 TaxID=3232307 RepID=A0AB39HBZ6_9VIBR|nr:lipopolysaccharide assembly protein LapA domain-containing protein [Vibrio sp. HB161653]MDP5253675.1 lipopolysaccharide assembly protein LapA domain-containing protein [Vibrio sp. HB161653]